MNLLATGPLPAALPGPPELPASCLQAVVVTAADRDDSAAGLQRWERSDPAALWKPAGRAWPVRLGRNGLAWGWGLHEVPADAATKREGDGKSPSGIFPLGPAFGSAPEGPPGLRFPWKQTTERDFFVDDPGSALYNQWVRLGPGVTGSWKSAERMRRDDLLYEFGMVVRHNAVAVRPGAGSAIFLHVWKSPESGTSGCTAMERADLVDLLLWLDPARDPLLVQAPMDDWSNLRLSLRSTSP
ncbi:MAG: L,D-transpeptidase family protein [Verrucomicrobia bacterium]|nr:L,D-transpeptidase family protein [Verrucomicrobiota bacterium]